MAGEAKTTQVLLSTATLMIGASDKVMGLTPDNDSIGLVKNLRVQTNMAFTDLTQGVTNTIVMSAMTKLDAKLSCEVYEYTAKNLAYGAGLDGSGLVSAAQTLTLNADAASGDTLTLTAGQGADAPAGSFLVLQDTAEPDNVLVTKVASVATDTLTLDAAYPIPTGVTFAKATTTIYVVNKVDVGANFSQPTFGVKAVGILPANGEPVTLVFPKVKITKGLDLSFESNNFSNMPFEFTPYVPVSTDPFYSDFKGKLYSVFKQ